MEALGYRLIVVLAVLSSLAATHRTPNFVVEARSEQIAEQAAQTAEKQRKKLARQWLGHELPPWARPCRLTVKVGRMGAGGATSFSFDRGHVFGWTMRVQGSLQRVLDSVIPHEVSHTIFATHFRRPLPRWADEGAATLAEHPSQKQRQQALLQRVFQNGGRIPLKRLLSMTEYPRNRQKVLTLYAQGYGLADYLVQRGGRARYLKFLEAAHRQGWEHAIEKHYDFTGVASLGKRWKSWIMAGSPRLDRGEAAQLADAETQPPKPDPQTVIRLQSPDRPANKESREQQDSPESRPVNPAQRRLSAGEERTPIGGREAVPTKKAAESLPASRRKTLPHPFVRLPFSDSK